VVVERQTPIGVRIRKDLFQPTKSHGYTPEGSDDDERESSSPAHDAGYKKKAKALRVLPSEKASKRVFYSLVGSGATVGYRY
jgi:hypothetical protein